MSRGTRKNGTYIGQQELWDIYDHRGHLVNVIERGKRIPDNCYHEGIEVIPTDCHGRMLVIQRSYAKFHGSGQWEFPAGSVITNETPEEAAIRELNEETGLTPDKLFLLCDARQYKMKRYFYVAYIEDLKNAEVKLQEGESIDSQLTDLNGFFNLIHDNKFNLSRLTEYPHEFYDLMEKFVGEPPKENRPEKRVIPEDITLYQCDKMLPTRTKNSIKSRSLKPDTLMEKSPLEVELEMQKSDNRKVSTQSNKISLDDIL